ncbi:hypothetical protein HWV62_11111 [Athelia sp. TMB]|nr:hypothetical protein HWV62_11111 [Athelia sp. TMB]
MHRRRRISTVVLSWRICNFRQLLPSLEKKRSEQRLNSRTTETSRTYRESNLCEYLQMLIEHGKPPRVLTENRRPLGYIDVASLKSKWEAGQANPDDKVSQYMVKFQRRASQPYSVITPDTPLAELESFLRENIFALITDYDRKFVLGVATSHDLENFVSRRGF